MDDFVLLEGLEYERPELISPGTLAYIGDAVYELYIRGMLVSDGIRNTGRMHNRAIGYVRASEQRKAFDRILPLLNHEETRISMRGRNATGTTPKNADPGDYSYATAFEALLGYLYLKRDRQRLMTLLGKATEEETDG